MIPSKLCNVGLENEKKIRNQRSYKYELGLRKVIGFNILFI